MITNYGCITGRLRIGFSSFAVLLYYAIANASAWTLGRRIIPAVGLVGCLVLAFVLPVLSQWVPPSSRSTPLGMDSPLGGTNRYSTTRDANCRWDETRRIGRHERSATAEE